MKKLSVVFSMLLVFALILAACSEEGGDGFDATVTPGDIGFGVTTPDAPPDTGAPGVTPGVQETPVVPDTGDTIDTATLNANRLSEILGYTVVDVNNEVVGTIQSVVASLQDGEIAYALVDVDADLDLDGDFVAIPWDAFDVTFGDMDGVTAPAATPGAVDAATPDPGFGADQGEQGQQQARIVLNTDVNSLANAPAFTDDAFDVNDPTWQQDIRTFWTNQGVTLPQTGQEADGMNLVRIDSANDFGVVDNEGNDLGGVDEMLVDPQEGMITHAVISRGGLLGLGGDLVPVPFEALSYDAQDNNFILNVSEEQLENAPTIEDYDNIYTPGWDDQFNTYWQGIAPGVGTPGTAATPIPGATGVITGTRNLYGLEEVIGFDVVNQNGEVIGNVDAMVVKRQEGNVRYVLMDIVDDLDLDNDYMAIPYEALEFRGEDMVMDGDVDVVATPAATPVPGDTTVVVNRENVFVYTLDQDVLLNAPTFADLDDLNVTTANWDDDWRTYWGNQVQVAPAATDAEGQAGDLLIRDTLGDYNLVDANGEDIGEIENIVFDPNEGQILYVVIGRGGVLGLGEDLVVIPFQNLDYDQNNNAFVLPGGEQALENAPTVDNADPTEWPAGFGDQVNTYWETQQDAQPTP